MEKEGSRILVVEDNPIVAEDLRMKLMKLGYQVTDTATSGEAALSSVQKERPDIVLMDINLGLGMSGIEAAATLREDFDISVIYLTAHADNDTVNRAKKTEPYGYIVKPFEYDELKSVIEVAVYKQQVDKQIMEKQIWLETTLNSIGDGVIATDTNGLISFLNPIAEEKTGWASKEAIGQPVDDVFHILDELTGRRIENPVHHVLATGERTYLADNTLLLSKNGESIPVKDCGTPIKLQTGELLGAVLVFQDDSKARRAKRELVARKKEAERYLNLAEVLFVGLDCEGRVLMMNDKARKVLDVDDEVVSGMDWFEHFVPEETRNNAREIFRDTISGTHHSHKYTEDGVVTRSGQLRQIAWRHTCIEDEGNTIIGILFSGEDITEKIQLRNKLQHARKMESIGHLAGGIAHDFNNILSAIIGFTELSMDVAEEGSELMDNLQEVQSAGMRGKDIVSQILYFSRQTKEECESTRVVPIARETVKLLRPLIPANIEIVEEYSGYGAVLGNPAQLHQVFMNLCTNAAQAMEGGGGALRISVHDTEPGGHGSEMAKPLQRGKYVKVTIADEGKGIPEDEIGAIFEPYFTTKEVGQGTGMGLAVVHGIVESYGGTITVKSDIGRGSEFTIWIPSVDNPGFQSVEQDEQIIHGKGHILFVDDEYPICKYAKKILEKTGYTVTTSTNPLEALEQFATSPDAFDLLITDITMPEMTGDVLARKILAIRPDFPVIVTSGYSKILYEKEFSKITIRAVALKPLNSAQFCQTVHQAITGDATIKVGG